MSMSKKCKSLIEEGYGFSVNHGNNLTNHLPMALVALDRMNAGEENLQNFSDNYIKKLEPLPKNTDFRKIASIEDHLGDQSYFLPYLNFFKNEISSKGVGLVVRESIPLLIRSPSSCAFHCLIRTSYAISSGLTHELAIALAYWASEFTTFKTKLKSNKVEVTDELENLALKFQSFSFTPGNISTRMNEVDNLLSESGYYITFPEYSLASIAEVALNLYAHTENFTLLHGVTATHAFRTLLPYIDNKNLALQYLWQGLVLAFLSTGLPLPTSPLIHKKLQITWEEIFEKAVKSTDAHTIKLVYTSWEEWRGYSNDLYIHIAYNKTIKP